MKIVILDGYALNPGDLSWKGFEKQGDLTVYEHTPADKIAERSKDAEILITNKTPLSAETISSLDKLKYIGVLATGYNIVDVKTAKEKGITVTNIPSYSTMSVAQRVFALLLTVTDRPEHYAIETAAGKWSSQRDFCYWNTPLMELAGKNFGIVGMGNIGKAVAKIALAFGMNVKAYSSKNRQDLPEGVEKVTLDELWKESDVISLHCPLTPETKEMVNEKSISEMKRGVILINTGRGQLVDEKGVAEGLASGKIGAFCADVLSTEPPCADNPLLKAPNTYITPHTAWATKEARTRLMDIAAANLEAFLKGTPQNCV